MLKEELWKTFIKPWGLLMEPTSKKFKNVWLLRNQNFKGIRVCWRLLHIYYLVLWVEFGFLSTQARLNLKSDIYECSELFCLAVCVWPQLCSASRCRLTSLEDNETIDKISVCLRTHTDTWIINRYFSLYVLDTETLFFTAIHLYYLLKPKVAPSPDI